jgi:GAF domain-containing protein
MDTTSQPGSTLDTIAEEALGIGGISSAVIFAARPEGAGLELAAAAGVQGAALAGLVAAVQNPDHPVARALTDDEPSFDMRPMAPGGPALRAHLALKPTASPGKAATGVLAVAYESPLGDSERAALVSLAARTADAL